MNILAIIQARMSSQRLPGKALLRIGGVAAVDHVYRRASSVLNAVVVIPDAQIDDVLAAHLYGENIPYFRGPEFNVLTRFHEAAHEYGPDVIMRLTADCPFIETDVMWQALKITEARFKEMDGDPQEDLFYCSNQWPVALAPWGYDVEVFSMAMLCEANEHADEPTQREHVTPWMREHIAYQVLPEPKPERVHNFTLDTPEDFEWFTAVAALVDVTPPNHPSADELKSLLERQPELVRYANETEAND